MRCWFGAALVGTAMVFIATATGRAQMPKEGDAAPDIEVPAAGIGKVLPGKKDGDKISLKDFQGKKNVVLFFFPKAMTKG